MPLFQLKPGGVHTFNAKSLTAPGGGPVQGNSGDKKKSKFRVTPGQVVEASSHLVFGGAKDRWELVAKGVPVACFKKEISDVLEPQASDVEDNLPPAMPQVPFVFPSEEEAGKYLVYRSPNDCATDIPVSKSQAMKIYRALLKEMEEGSEEENED